MISVCIPTFNGEKYLLQALESVIEQTCLPLEIVISDDNSSDRTLDIAEKFAETSPVPVYIVKHKPQGIGANWNNCIKHAKGAYIKFLFQDDVLYPDCIEKMQGFISEHQDVELLFCKRKLIGDTDKESFKQWDAQYSDLFRGWKKYPKEIALGKELLKDPNFLKLPNNKLGEPTASLIKSSLFKTYGLFNIKLKQRLDYEYWYRVLSTCSVGFIHHELVGFRLHDAQASQANNTHMPDENKEYLKCLFSNFRFYTVKNKIELLKRLIKIYFK